MNLDPKDLLPWIGAALTAPVAMVWKKATGAVQKEDMEKILSAINKRHDEHLEDDIRRFTIRNCFLELTGVASFLGWSGTDTTGVYEMSNNHFEVAAAVEDFTLQGLSFVFKGNKVFLRTGYANTNNSGTLIGNNPFVTYTDCEFWNDTTNSCNVGGGNLLSRQQNCFFDVDVTFNGRLSDGQLFKELGDVSTSSTGEDDLMSYTVPADRTGINGTGIRITATGTKTNSNGNKTVSLYVNGTAYVFNAAANDTNDWRVQAEVYAINATTARVCVLGFNGTTIFQDNGPLAVAFASGFIVKLTGECANGSDVITQNSMMVEQI